MPIFSLADLGFHELGHMLTYPLPDLITASMGSILQIAVPWGLAAYFMLFRNDPLGGTFCLAWAGSSAQNVSIYIADAPYQTLDLIGGEHDWAYLLGPEQFDALGKAASIASVTKGIGAAMLCVAIAICVAGLLLSYRPTAST